MENKDNKWHIEMILGIPVKFPFKPYPSQLSMMNRIINSIEKRNNSLLESPTGSGKSMAIICASLAWLCKEKDRIRNKEKMSMSSMPCENCTKFAQIPAGECCQKCDCQVKSNPNPEPENERSPQVFICSRTHRQITQLIHEFRRTPYTFLTMSVLGSRDHMCIESTVKYRPNCSVTEACREKLKYGSCRYKNKVEKVATPGRLAVNAGVSGAWDIEDLVTKLEQFGACPYFTSRELALKSDIVFCPYNYLLDPIFRQAVKINLKNSIIIVDEAHNMEDVAREAASFTVTTDQLESAKKDLTELKEFVPVHAPPLLDLVETLLLFILDTQSILKQKQTEEAYEMWKDDQVVILLKRLNIDLKNFDMWQTHFNQMEQEAKEKEESPPPSPPKNSRRRPLPKVNKRLTVEGSTMIMFESLFQCFSILLQREMCNLKHYRITLTQDFSRTVASGISSSSSSSFLNAESASQTQSSKPLNRIWFNKRRSESQSIHEPSTNVIPASLNFWCFNSAVIFEELNELARSIILTSGTLAPLASFECELGVPFPNRLEAFHVINSDQIFVASVKEGPSQLEMHMVYKNCESYEYQDELGTMICLLCETVPNGILCFLNSYTFIDKLKTRWENTSIYNRLANRKHVLFESRNSTEFDPMIVKFYNLIESSKKSSGTLATDGKDGVILFAVCRGKVSEGLDFSDDRARLVITVGIPFPFLKDLKVQLKRQFNDEVRNSKPNDKGVNKSIDLLPGNKWYEIQAFRALNQALGRCIRHRNDWGALILIDSRFVPTSQSSWLSISKWVRKNAMAFDKFHRLLEDLRRFIQMRQSIDKNECELANEADFLG